MRKLAHIGIPVSERPAKAAYLPDAKLCVTDPADSKNNIEFIYFEPDSPMPELMKKSTHIAYFVENLDEELKGAQILVEPFSPFPGVTAAFIVEDGLPIELLRK